MPPRCFDCGHEAEYVGLDKVENCSNKECRYGVPVKQSDPVPVTLAVAEVHHVRAKSMPVSHRKPEPVMRPAKSCASCWAYDGKKCGKYDRGELTLIRAVQTTCDNHEFPPRDDRAGDLKFHFCSSDVRRRCTSSR